MKTKYALPMVLAGSVVLSGCWLDDDDDPATTSVRILHASSDAPAVNVRVNGDVVVPGADYKQAAVLTPGAGLADIAVDGLLPGGETATVISADGVSLRSDTKYDVIAVGKLANIEPLILTDSGERESADSVRLRVAHLSPVAQEAVDGPVEVYLTLAGDPLPEEASFSFSFKESVGPIEVPAGDYQIRVAITGETPTVVYDSGSVPLAAGSDLLVGAVDNTTPETTPDGEEAVNNSPVSLIAVTGDGQVIELFDSSQQAGVRVVHNSSDAPAVAVLVDDTVAIPSLAFPNVAPAAGTNSYAVIPDGSRNLKVSPAASENPVNSAVIDADVVFGQASAKTVIAVNLLEAIEPLVLEDSVRSIATQASLRVVHGAVEAGTVDVYLVPTAEGGAEATVLNAEVNAPTLNDFEFKTNTGYLPVAAGAYVVFITDQDGNELLKTGSVSLSAGGVYTAIARLAPEDADNTAGLTLLDDFPTSQPQ
ncbi:MAG: DUF4397 domain-containing protein [Marinobacter adhaerens]|uniref:DUF4397 domain-containing protein n=1 Tax=Marinobacter adhaerens TaxID=1033846 RepID=UPI003C68A8A1